MAFLNREEAGGRLAEKLARLRGEDVVVFALPRGGVPVAAPVAAALGAPLDLVLVRKIGAPYQPELAMGAVADGRAPVVVRNEDVIDVLGVSDARFDEACARECAEIERRRALYLGERPRAQAQGRVAVVVDDGVATGATTRAALRAVRAQAPKRLILAVPVASTEALDALAAEADEIVCLEAHDWFRGVGGYYADFRQTEDTEVIALLDRYGSGAARG
ncbi:MAG: phosphoribosyltransferase [Methylocystis sp.]|uniref:phosphoribosyltransferase n=1 Tax=Methylocystis sp. TaxID=1911079 RepID=UPI003DA32266